MLARLPAAPATHGGSSGAQSATAGLTLAIGLGALIVGRRRSR
jgi:hypothetical protein